MTFANIGHLGTLPGRRDDLVAILTRPGPALAEAGCLLYEVGVNDDEPDTVFVAELWTSAQAHRASLELPAVQAAIAEAQPLLSGEFGGSRFTVVGSPLRAHRRRDGVTHLAGSHENPAAARDATDHHPTDG